MKVRKMVVLIVASICTLPGAELQPANRAEAFTRDLAQQPVARYQAGSVFSRDASLSTIWVEKTASGGAVWETQLAIPDSFRVVVSDVAVSYDGTVAASASASDKEGRLASVIVWLSPDGSILRVVRTTPFGAVKIAFTADGALWALGVVKSDETLREEAPVHDVLHRYDRDGKLSGTYLSRLSLSAGGPHPSRKALLVTSRERVAIVSESAGKWVVLGVDGGVLGQGHLGLPAEFRTFVAAVTDSGRLFVGGDWSDRKFGDGGTTRPAPLFEVDQETGDISPLDVANNELGYLLGSDGEQLVFYSESGHKIVWRSVN